MSPRTQTLVQLTDELVARLDEHAARRGISRSALVRELVAQGLAQERRDEASERLRRGYLRDPQVEGRDAWGDLSDWVAANARRNRAALAREEGDDAW